LSKSSKASKAGAWYKTGTKLFRTKSRAHLQFNRFAGTFLVGTQIIPHLAKGAEPLFIRDEFPPARTCCDT
jgi:hypothetical protein